MQILSYNMQHKCVYTVGYKSALICPSCIDILGLLGGNSLNSCHSNSTCTYSILRNVCALFSVLSRRSDAMNEIFLEDHLAALFRRFWEAERLEVENAAGNHVSAWGRRRSRRKGPNAVKLRSRGASCESGLTHPEPNESFCKRERYSVSKKWGQWKDTWGGGIRKIRNRSGWRGRTGKIKCAWKRHKETFYFMLIKLK